MEKQFYSYQGSKHSGDILLHLSAADLKQHKKLVDAIVATGIININKTGDYTIDIQADKSIAVLLNGKLVGTFRPATVN